MSDAAIDICTPRHALSDQDHTPRLSLGLGASARVPLLGTPLGLCLLFHESRDGYIHLR